MFLWATILTGLTLANKMPSQKKIHFKLIGQDLPLLMDLSHPTSFVHNQSIVFPCLFKKCSLLIKAMMSLSIMSYATFHLTFVGIVNQQECLLPKSKQPFVVQPPDLLLTIFQSGKCYISQVHFQ